MLTKLAILNSEKHAKIIIAFDATAIQIVGENKIGKTTLIDSLNFLYIIDKRQMSFDSRGGKSTYNIKQSLAHFFPSANQSFIVFECYKAKANGYFCILVKRKNIEDDVEYFKIDKEFEEKDYIDAAGNLMKFDEIRKNFTLNNAISALKNKSDFFQWVYNKDVKRNAFLWVSEKVARKGQSLENSLTKTYRFLLNASSIDDSALREALIIAGSQQDLILDIFSNKSNIQQVENLKKQSNYIQKLAQIKQEFEAFKLLVNLTAVNKKAVVSLLFSFDKLIKEALDNQKNQIEATKKELEQYKKEQGNIQAQGQELSRNIGSLSEKIRNLEGEKIQNLAQTLAQIEAILNDTSPLHRDVDSLTAFLEAEKEGLKKAAEEIAAILQTISQYHFTEAQVLNKIKQFEAEKTQISSKISNYQDLLIHNISDNKEIREKINAIFSQEMLAKFRKNNLLVPIQFLDNILNINGGKIEGLDGIKAKPLESIEELKQLLPTKEQELKQQKDILETIRNRDEKQKQKSDLQAEINKISDKINKISQKEAVENKISDLKKELLALKNELAGNYNKQAAIASEVAKIGQLIDKNNQQIRDVEQQIGTYHDWQKEFEQELKDTIFVDNEEFINKPIAELRLELRREKRNLESKKQEKQTKFLELQKKTENDAAEPLFIEQIAQDILSLELKQNSIETLLEQISTQFTKPVEDFLARYKHFEVFIKTFNKSISEYKISDLKELKIELKINSNLFSDLDKIRKIICVGDLKMDLFSEQLNSPEQQSYLAILDKYIQEKNEDIHFKDLFDISLEARDENDKPKNIDLKAGNESQGTIRMINLILFLLVIKYFKTDDEENKLIFFIDEDVIDSNNTSQLIRFCKENGFVVIFAAKHQIGGLEKYYFIKKSAAHLNKVYADERNVIVAQKVD
jgi:chromosome segregation ATPase